MHKEQLVGCFVYYCSVFLCPSAVSFVVKEMVYLESQTVHGNPDFIGRAHRQADRGAVTFENEVRDGEERVSS